MSDRELGRLLDPAVLDAAEGARARMRIEVPPTWIDEGASIEVTAPRRLTCARCDGGGCDGCDRSGAIRAPEGAAERCVRAGLPRGVEGIAVLRLLEPFGAEAGVAQLLVEIHPAPEPSPGVTRVAIEQAKPARVAVPWPAIAAAALVALSIVAALLGR